jgi:hypothetical protein
LSGWCGWRDPLGGEEGFQQAKGEVGLDHYEVRRLLVALVWTTPVQPGLVLVWSGGVLAARRLPL